MNRPIHTRLAPRPRVLAAMCVAFRALVIAGAMVIVSGCDHVPPVWSRQATSPDGRATVSAQRWDNGGPGTAGPSIATVQIKLTHDSKPTEIFGLEEANIGAENLDMTMKWLASTRLELTFHIGLTVAPEPLCSPRVQRLSVPIRRRCANWRDRRDRWHVRTLPRLRGRA